MSGRSRAQQSNFWATGLSKMTSRGRAFAESVNAIIREKGSPYSLLWVGSGWRTGSKEHVSGDALDIITSADTGIDTEKREPLAFKQAMNFVNNVLIKNANALHIRHIIFNGRIWRRRKNAWGVYLRRGSVSIAHRDHIHVLLEGGSSGSVSATFAAIKRSMGKDAANVPPKPQSQATTNVLRKGSKGSTVSALQRELNRLFPAYAGSLSIDGDFGSHTHTVVVEFQRRAKKDGRYAGAIDGIVGLGTLKALRAYGARL